MPSRPSNNLSNDVNTRRALPPIGGFPSNDHKPIRVRPDAICLDWRVSEFGEYVSDKDIAEGATFLQEVEYGALEWLTFDGTGFVYVDSYQQAAQHIYQHSFTAHDFVGKTFNFDVQWLNNNNPWKKS